MKSKRGLKLNSEFRKLIYDAIKVRLNIPEVTEMFSITEVDCAPDLKTAKVYISVYSADENKKKATFNGIKNASGDIRRIISSEMHIRTVPEFRFFEDGALEYGNKIDKIISGFTYHTESDDDTDKDDENR